MVRRAGDKDIEAEGACRVHFHGLDVYWGFYAQTIKLIVRPDYQVGWVLSGCHHRASTVNTISTDILETSGQRGLKRVRQ